MATPTIHNSSGYSTETIENQRRLGSFRNNWRGRTVTLYAHPTETDWVISVGTGEVGSNYARQLAGNWSAYN